MWNDENIPDKYWPYVTGCKKLNKGYNYTLWTDEALEKYIAEEYPMYLELYKSYPYFIERKDAARYLLLQK